MCKPYKLLKELEIYMKRGKKIPESTANRPIMADKFRFRTYYLFSGISKMFILHSKIDKFRYHDALMFIHDVPFYEFKQIEMILKKLPSVQGFHLSTVEHRWDFYPMHATELQLHLAQHLHLKHSRSTKRRGKWPRFTFYINDKPTDLQSKIYIRPKEPNTQSKEFVRFELTSRRRWMKNNGIQMPSDYKKIEFYELIKQVLWLEVDFGAIERSILNIVTNNLWLRIIKNRLYSQGISSVIMVNRRRRSCLRHCAKKSYSSKCPLVKAMINEKSDYERFKSIQDCKHASPMKNFQMEYCRKSKLSFKINKIMKRDYDDWKKEH